MIAFILTSVQRAHGSNAMFVFNRSLAAVLAGLFVAALPLFLLG